MKCSRKISVTSFTSYSFKNNRYVWICLVNDVVIFKMKAEYTTQTVDIDDLYIMNYPMQVCNICSKWINSYYNDSSLLYKNYFQYTV